MRAPIIRGLRRALHGRKGTEATNHVHMTLQKIASISSASNGPNSNRELRVGGEKKAIMNHEQAMVK